MKALQGMYSLVAEFLVQTFKNPHPVLDKVVVVV